MREAQEISSEREEERAGMEVLSMLLILLFSLLLGSELKKRIHRGGQEASAALALGMGAGLLSWFLDYDEEDTRWMRFQENFFFLFLLPPIIFESGFAMKPGPFFRNFGAICTLAFLGTLLSTAAIGILIYIAGRLNIAYPLSLLESHMFGALASATDPVSVLAIFQEQQVDEDLYALVFGESVLNDAVAIVLFGTFATYRNAKMPSPSVTAACGRFVWIFVGSMCVGVMVALLSAILFKIAKVEEGEEGQVQSCVLVCFSYCAYMLSEGVGLSGIVAILFCGIVMAHYTTKNLSPKARKSSLYFFKILAKLAETFVFVYIGASVFSEQHSKAHVTLAISGLVAIIASRAASVFPCGIIINRARSKDRRIPTNQLIMLWFSGLRGPVAFALAVQAASQLGRGAGGAIMTMSIAVILFTVFVVGNLTTSALRFLDIRCGRAGFPAEKTSYAEENEDFEIDGSSDGVGHLATNGFSNFDEKYLTPLFTSQHEVELIPFDRTGDE